MTGPIDEPADDQPRTEPAEPTAPEAAAEATPEGEVPVEAPAEAEAEVKPEAPAPADAADWRRRHLPWSRRAPAAAPVQAQEAAPEAAPAQPETPTPARGGRAGTARRSPAPTPPATDAAAPAPAADPAPAAAPLAPASWTPETPVVAPVAQTAWTPPPAPRSPPPPRRLSRGARGRPHDAVTRAPAPPSQRRRRRSPAPVSTRPHGPTRPPSPGCPTAESLASRCGGRSHRRRPGHRSGRTSSGRSADHDRCRPSHRSLPASRPPRSSRPRRPDPNRPDAAAGADSLAPGPATRRAQRRDRVELPELPPKPGAARHVLGILVGLVLTPIGLVLTAVGLARFRALDATLADACVVRHHEPVAHPGRRRRAGCRRAARRLVTCRPADRRAAVGRRPRRALRRLATRGRGLDRRRVLHQADLGGRAVSALNNGTWLVLGVLLAIAGVAVGVARRMGRRFGEHLVLATQARNEVTAADESRRRAAEAAEEARAIRAQAIY